MIFEFKNIGLIESAKIELKGLTVITGLNDTGKSFISKGIYSIIKTVNEANVQASSEKFEQINTLVNNIFSLHRQYVPFTPQRIQQFNPNDLINNLFALLNTLPSVQAENLINNYTEKVFEDLRSVNSPQLVPHINIIIGRIESIRKNILSLLKEEGDEEKKYKAFFEKIVIQKLFQGQLNNINSKDEILEIKITEGATQLINISVSNNKIQSFIVENSLLLNDATLIETPTILQLAKFITTTLAFPTALKKLFQQRTDLPYPYYDLLEKMNTPSNISDLYSEVYKEIKHTIKGEILYKVEEGFVFMNENGNSIKSFNIATGIKSFGLIQLLLNSGAINPKSILIIDEPEVHLHPLWEVEYAKMIVILSTLGIPIIISTHSPYFLQSLIKYVKDFKFQDFTKFYFGEKTPNGKTSKFIDVTENVEPIFKALSEPMQQLYL